MKPNTLVLGWYAPQELPRETLTVYTEAPEVIAKFPPLRTEPSSLVLKIIDMVVPILLRLFGLPCMLSVAYLSCCVFCLL